MQKEGIELQKMTLGLEILLHNIPKLVLMVAVSAILGILTQTIITWFSFVCIRRYASGLHATNSITCSVTTLLMFVLTPYILYGFHINMWILVVIFAVIGFGLFKYAPADTAARPILGKRKREKLKKKAVIASGILLVLALLLNNEAFYTLIAAGAVYALILVLPFTYKILGRSTNNYEKFE